MRILLIASACEGGPGFLRAPPSSPYIVTARTATGRPRSDPGQLGLRAGGPLRPLNGRDLGAGDRAGDDLRPTDRALGDFGRSLVADGIGVDRDAERAEHIVAAVE